MNWRLERLSSAHNSRGFKSGEHQLDHFLKRHALSNDNRGLGATYVAVEEESGRILGYVTVCATSIHFEHVPEENVPHYPVPCILIARLAVDRSAQGHGIGIALVLSALEIAVELADRIGIHAVVVDALTAAAKSFYPRHFGFTELLDNPYHLFVTIADLRASGL